MSESKFIISEKQILDAVKYAIGLHIKTPEILGLLMKDVEDEIETVLFDDCEEALEQDSILDKIKEEIQDNTYFINEVTEKEGIDFETVEKIIDKYKAESEVADERKADEEASEKTDSHTSIR